MAIKDITIENIKDFCGISDDASDALLVGFQAAAYNLIKAYTALSDEEINSYDDLTTAYLVLINDMYNNRDYTTANDKINPLVATILSLHSGNLVG